MNASIIKTIIVFVVGVLLEISISATIPLQAKHWTYILAGTTYLIMGMLSHKYQLNGYQKGLFLLPLIMLKSFAISVNNLNIPFAFPFTFFISLIGFFLGYFILKKMRPVLLICLIVYAYAVYVIGFSISPKLIYEKSVANPILYPKEKLTTWNLLDLNGNKVPFENVQGKVVLLNFTWKNCSQCIEKQPFTTILQQKYKYEKKLVILEVDLGKFDTITEAIALAKKSDNDLTWVYDAQNTLANKLLFAGAPHEVLIDKEGNIDFISAGFNRDISLIYVDEISRKIDIALSEITNN
jgi:thiol-disulfide isomerase/thioredoxin